MAELLPRIVDHTVWGDYLFNYRFVSFIDQNGGVEGTNNVGSYNTGRWHVDEADGTFNIQFNQSWVPASLVAYAVGDVLHFFNKATGLWYVSFDKIIAGKQPLVV